LSTDFRARISGRVPRADKLNLLRDIVHLLNEEGGISGKKRLFYKTRRRISKPEANFPVQSTFKDYLDIGTKLALFETTLSVARISKKGKHLVGISKFGGTRLLEPERKFFRSLLLEYRPFRIFLSIGFCDRVAFQSEDELFRYAGCPTRETIMRAYMETKRQDTDREARTLLGWSVQIGLVEFDEYYRRHYLTREKEVSLKSFLNILHKAFLKVREPRTGTALIPEVRFHCCCAGKIKRNIFDSNLMWLYEDRPSEIQLSRGSASRDEVLKFGIKGKTYYYYYIKLPHA